MCNCKLEHKVGNLHHTFKLMIKMMSLHTWGQNIFTTFFQMQSTNNKVCGLSGLAGTLFLEGRMAFVF